MGSDDDDSQSDDDSIIWVHGGPFGPCVPDDDSYYCDIEFDGASMASPGKCGAGAIVRARDGRTWRLRKGLGITTITVAKYRGLMLGLRFAAEEGFLKINATSDSILICNQVEGKWDIKNPRLTALNEEVRGFEAHFYEFTVSHVRRELNAEAAFQADQASHLPNGRMEKDIANHWRRRLMMMMRVQSFMVLAMVMMMMMMMMRVQSFMVLAMVMMMMMMMMRVQSFMVLAMVMMMMMRMGVLVLVKIMLMITVQSRYFGYLEDNSSEQCNIEYDGASKGNPGKGGAGAIVRARDGRIWRLRKGLGTTTSNVAEYRGLILGMRFAIEKGFQMIHVTGDSLLICNQVNDKWAIRNPNLIALNKEVQDLKNKLSKFTISHVGREFNGEADSQANRASYLPNGVTEVD